MRADRPPGSRQVLAGCLAAAVRSLFAGAWRSVRRTPMSYPLAVLPGVGRAARLAAKVARLTGLCSPMRGGSTFDIDDRIEALMWAGVYEPGTCAVLDAVLLRCGP